jgi:hypothetical protein
MDRVLRLESQVMGLMETVNRLHEACNLYSIRIPLPDQYVRARENTTADNQKKPLPLLENATFLSIQILLQVK